MSSFQDESEFEQLPDLYQRWVMELLPGGIPREREATCLDCAMCAGSGGCGENTLELYNPATKCCTYFPELPNYLVGRAIGVDTPGAQALRNFIEDDQDTRGVATLRSVRPDAKIATIYSRHHQEGFGQDIEMLCPYAIPSSAGEGPLCGIWKQRNSVCSTWFCKHTKGVTGYHFWRSLQGLLASLERSLSWWAITQVLQTPAAAISVSAFRVDRRNEITLRADAWKQWPGSRAAFYEACAEHVERLSAREAIAIAGMEGQLHEIELNSRYGSLHAQELPPRLQVAPFKIVGQDGRRTILQPTQWPEALDAPAALVPLLRYFDGRPTEAAIEAIRLETQTRLDPKLVRRLYDFGILVEIEN